MGLKELKAKERRKKIRKYIRQGLSEVTMANRLKVNITTICGDVKIIKRENAHRIIANKDLIEKNVKNLLECLEELSVISKEIWKIYYDEAVTTQDKLTAMERIRKNIEDRAKLLKLLNPTQINVGKMVYIEKQIPIMIDKVLNIVLEYVPDKQKQIELLKKIEVINVEGEK